MNSYNPSNIFRLIQAGSDHLKWVTVIGAGRLGSNVAMLLHQKGLNQILIDDDWVSEQNIQSGHMMPYGYEDIGKFKVDALREKMIKARIFPDVKTYRCHITSRMNPNQLDSLLGESVLVLWAIDSHEGLRFLESKMLSMMKMRIHIFAAMHGKTGGGHVAIWIPSLTPCVKHSIGLEAFSQIVQSRAEASGIVNSDIRIVTESTAKVIFSIVKKRHGLISDHFDLAGGNYMHIEKLGNSDIYRKFWIKPQGDPNCQLCVDR